MADETIIPDTPADTKGKLPVGFWWIAVGILLLLCGIAVILSVLPRLLDGSIMAQTSTGSRHPEGYIVGPLLPGIFAIAYGIDLRRKAGLSCIPFIFSGIASDEEKK